MVQPQWNLSRRDSSSLVSSLSIDRSDRFRGGGLEPLLVEVRLGGEQCVAVAAEVEGAAGALLGLHVVLPDPVDRIVAIDDQRGEPGFGLVRRGGLGIEVVLIRFADVLGEDACGDGFLDRGTGDEQVGPRGAQVDGPGDGLRPRPGDEVEDEAADAGP